jgi:ArsR family transcriptional regulator, arsenate/arsenite/antimonite-responsive transcriptional repressor
VGLSKTEHFTKEQLELAELAKALAHPARIAILQYLLKTNACVCGDIVDALPLAQSTVSQHLKELKKVGILKGEIEGASVCYCIDFVTWKKAENIFTAFFAALNSACDGECC